MVGANGGNQFRQYAGQNVGYQNRYNAVQNVRNQVVQDAVQNQGVQNIGVTTAEDWVILLGNCLTVRPRRRDAALSPDSVVDCSKGRSRNLQLQA
ncbi:hypothetical protein Tco_0976463 [Tanacetum coccineum]|uniref:Uncharacterized protein n=1 Tax=Tanacetum coccineum TaxID=301880 RepID=A0ABQ5EHF8_9ASTR